MSWFRRTLQSTRRSARVSRQNSQMDELVLAHLDDFRTTKRGVEAWVEDATAMNRPSILLVASSGEWTRRSVPSVLWAHHYARRHDMPSYDAGVVAYPQRMRDHNRKRKLRPDEFRPGW